MIPAPAASGAATQLVDDFEPFEHQALAGDPLHWPGYPQRLEAARERTGDEQAVTTGRAHIGGRACIVVAFNFAFMGGSMGEAEGARIVAAADVSARERLPLVTVLRSGGARMQEGMRSLVQMARVSASLTRLAAATVPHVCIARNPTTGGVWASIGAGADVILAESGAQIAFAGSAVRGTAEADRSMFTAEAKLAHGFVDAVLPAPVLREQLALAVELLAPESRGQLIPPSLPEPLSVGRPDSGWQQVTRARSAGKPSGDDYLSAYFSRVLEIRGDRVGGVDCGIRCGFGRRGDRTIAFVAQGSEQTTAAGYRTAARLIDLADRLRIPVLTLIDSPGADGSTAGEASGVGTAIAGCFRSVAQATVPILSVAIGQGGSGGSLGLAAIDNLWMTTDGYFSVIEPESAAAILRRPPEDVPVVAEQLRLGPEELQGLGIVRGIVGHNGR